MPGRNIPKTGDVAYCDWFTARFIRLQYVLCALGFGGGWSDGRTRRRECPYTAGP